MPDFLSEVLAPANWPTFVFILARLSGFAITAPLWTMTPLNRTMRAAMIVVLAIVLLPSSPRVPYPGQVLDLPFPLGMEIVVGVVIGMSSAVLIYGVGFAGQVLALQMGLSLGPVFMPMAGHPESGIGKIKSFMAMVIYLGIGGHLTLLRGLADSLVSLPPGSPMSPVSGGGAAALVAGTVFSTAISVAAPVMVTLLLTHAAVAILNRAVPQIHTMLVAFPLTIGIGLIMIGAALPLTVSAIRVWMNSIQGNLDGAVNSFQIVGMGP
jgi:flagellar biosynthetic protein FliR